MAGGREPINKSFRVLIADSNIPVQVPDFFVPEGCTVYVRAHNGKAAGNSAPVFIGKRRDVAASGESGQGNVPLQPNTQVGWPCTTTADIWVFGNAGDGVTIQILG